MIAFSKGNNNADNDQYPPLGPFARVSITENNTTNQYDMSLDTLEGGPVLGHGQFGVVRIMRHASSNLKFAVKVWT
jgi:hypothetical protein